MARKTPAHVLKLLERFEEKMVHFEEILRVKANLPVENQADHVRNNSFDYYYGMIQGSVSSMEEVLHEFGCYHGFFYVGPDRFSLIHVAGQKIQDNPDYRDWRIMFYTR